jgi:Adenylate cyclase, family 3 (some proteins contain HAMP domain)
MRPWRLRHLRKSASPAAVLSLTPTGCEIDIRHLLPLLREPRLVVHAARDTDIHGRAACASASCIAPVPIGPDRVLATILFSDIVDSTEHALALGDRLWCDLLAQYHVLVRDELSHFRGREMDCAGDGFFAAFDAPARAVRCAAHLLDAVHSLGIDIRVGLHAGECETEDDKMVGIAVHVGARAACVAQPGEIVVSSTVRDLVAGSGLRFGDRGIHTLKGFVEPWHLFTVDLASARL